jgi:hypothetical protein
MSMQTPKTVNTNPGSSPWGPKPKIKDAAGAKTPAVMMAVAKLLNHVAVSFLLSLRTILFISETDR